MSFNFDDIVDELPVETVEVELLQKFRPKKFDFVIYVTYPTIYTDLKRYNRLFSVIRELSKKCHGSVEHRKHSNMLFMFTFF